MSLATALVLLASLVVSGGFLLIVVSLIWWIDRYDREPLHLVVMVFLWGASVAPLLAVTTFGLIDRVMSSFGETATIASISIGFVTPLVEEIAKGLVVVLIVLFSSKFDNPGCISNGLRQRQAQFDGRLGPRYFSRSLARLTW